MSDLAATAKNASANAAAAIEENLDATKRAAQRLGDDLQQRLHDVGDRVHEVSSQLPDFREELRDDAAWVADRARYYHRNRPLDALRFVAAAAFVIGLFIGLGRR